MAVKIKDYDGQMKRFHAHIYFEQRDLEIARLLAHRARNVGHFDSIRLHTDSIGPHPLGMIEGHFVEHSYLSVLSWLKANRGSLSVLIHTDTGDDFRDHTDGALWLGISVALDFGFFERIQARPDLRIHPVS